MIFICKFDPFGLGQYRYHFENICHEAPLLLKDGAHKLFFNTTGKKGNISAQLKELLEYMNDAKRYPVDECENPIIRKLDENVAEAKMDEEWRNEFMTQQIRDRMCELRGVEIGKAQGEEIGIAKGERIGAQKSTRAVAKKMLAMQMDANSIIAVTGLTLSELEKIRAEIPLN